MVVAIVSGICVPAIGQTEDPVSLVVVAPKTLYTESPGTVSVTAVTTTAQTPAVVAVSLQLIDSGSTSAELFNGITDSTGRLSATFDVGDISPGAYTLKITAQGVGEPVTASVQVRKMPIVLIETDKPIYKPGQKIKGRVLVLSNKLRPRSSDVSVQITDGKGVKIFREELTTNAFGVAPFELPLATELNFGTWKITAESGASSGFVDVRVEKYVLPRFDVEVIMEKDYVLVDQPVAGAVVAAYFFGKPVDGSVHVVAERYVGVWEQYAEYTAPLIEGKADFTLPAVGYAAGTSGAGGAGSAQLHITVTDTSGHEEKTTSLLKVVDSSLNHRLIALSRVIIPDQPFEVMLIAENQEGDPVTASARLTCTYYDQYRQQIGAEEMSVEHFTGSTTVLLKTPEGVASAEINSTAKTANGTSADANLVVYAAYSPTDSFLHLSRNSEKPVTVGDVVTIDVFKTHPATVYYDVFAAGHTVWSGATVTPQITFHATPQMTPSAKVVAYIINPNNEISADAIDLDVTMANSTSLEVVFNADKVLPGDSVQLSIQADTEAMIGLAIVDESVYALNEGRLNMQEVFNELERLFMEPQSETHSDSWTSGAYGVFEDAGLQILTSEGVDVPQGRQIWRWDKWWWRGDWEEVMWLDAVMPGATYAGAGNGLAEVTRVRQFFPETWLWTPDLLTDEDGAATLDLTAPDSITTWRLHAVSTSKDGLGISESQLLVFQEFFGEPDLPYAVTRGEQFPVRIQVFNYLEEPQVVYVELAKADWFELLDGNVQELEVAANGVALASFVIQPTKLGRNTIDVTLRSKLRADAVRKELLVEPEGTQREIITNGMIKAGQTVKLKATMPDYRVEGSEKVLLSVTPSLVAQSINGVEDLLHMPYGCGEQNMIFFAPDVEILRYLDATGQLTPEVRAKAEEFIIAGYQRELTYRRADGSFSAFGDNDDSGSLWLTAFVLDVFSAARDVQTIDENVLATAASWIEAQQASDGSWEPVGFVHHKEMIGGLAGKYTLTAFVTIALADYGAGSPAVLNNAVQYLIDNMTTVSDDAYALAVTALALARIDNPACDDVLARLLEIAIADGTGIHWQPHDIETTAYVALAMIEREMAQANEAIKWLSLQQNAQGGFGHTQDTVMALKALMTAARAQTRNVNLKLTAKGSDGEVLAQFTVDSSNFDVLQIAEIPLTSTVALIAEGSGEVRYQLVRRFNVLLHDDCVNNDMSLEVTYDAENIEVDDIVNVNVTVRYLASAPSSGMMIVDVGVPTGFEVLQDSLDALVTAGLVSRVDLAGRKVILYVDELTGGEERTFTFKVRARFPVRAVIPDSKAYLYYEPDTKAEYQGREITVALNGTGTHYGFENLLHLAKNWLQPADPAEDLYPDGTFDLHDFAVIAQGWLAGPD
jgi:CD109 antigen